ncbi:hypothetical protein ACFLVS_04655 [Chloroflexota bacterium]
MKDGSGSWANKKMNCAKAQSGFLLLSFAKVSAVIEGIDRISCRCYRFKHKEGRCALGIMTHNPKSAKSILSFFIIALLLGITLCSMPVRVTRADDFYTWYFAEGSTGGPDGFETWMGNVG